MKIQIRNTVVTAGLAVAVGASGAAVAGMQTGSVVYNVAVVANGDARLSVGGEGVDRPECLTQEDTWVILGEDDSLREMAMRIGFEGGYIEVIGTGECKGGREIVKSVTRINGPE